MTKDNKQDNKSQEIICPKCGCTDNFHFNYDYSKKDYENHIESVLCNECGHFFDFPIKNISDI